MKKTNILLITSDQQHFNTLGAINPKIKTPALDRICSEGVRFDRAYCSNPVCSPSRASILTGLYPAWHHCWTIGVKLPEDVPTVNDEFVKDGYETCLIGKAHFQPMLSEPGSDSIECMPIIRDLDFWRGFYGPWYGFKHVETARLHANQSAVGQHYAVWMEEKGFKDWKDYFTPLKGEPNVRNYPEAGYTHGMMKWDLPDDFHHSTWIGERTCAKIDEYVKSDNPFFLWASFPDPHPPYACPEPWVSMYDPEDMEPGALVEGEWDKLAPHFRKVWEKNADWSEFKEEGGRYLHGFHSQRTTPEKMKQAMACYYGMISLMDREIGRMLDKLDELGIAENTLVLFTTDHGHFLGQHGLNAKGAFHYEDMLRIPMCARFPGHIPAGRIDNTMQSQIDFAPTFLSAAGIEIPGLMQGLDQLDVWSGKKGEIRDHVIVENRHNPTKVHLRTYINHDFKLTLYRGWEYGELFDLSNDPKELSNEWDNPDFQQIKAKLLFEFVQAEIKREPTRMPRIATA